MPSRLDHWPLIFLTTPPLIWAVLMTGPDHSRTSSRSPPGTRQGCRLHLPNKQTSSGSEILSVSHCVPLLQKRAPLVQEFLHVPADASLRVQALLPACHQLLLPLFPCSHWCSVSRAWLRSWITWDFVTRRFWPNKSEVAQDSAFLTSSQVTPMQVHHSAAAPGLQFLHLCSWHSP